MAEVEEASIKIIMEAMMAMVTARAAMLISGSTFPNVSKMSVWRVTWAEIAPLETIKLSM